MEPGDQQICEEWSSLSGLYTAEEADFMNHFLANCDGHFNLGTPSAFWPSHESNVTGINHNISYFPAQGTSLNADSGGNGNYSSNNQVTSFGSMQGINDSKQINENKNLQAHKECEILDSEPEEDKIRVKRSRNSIKVPKKKRNVKCKKNSECGCISNTKEDTGPGPQGQTLSSYCSDDESNASEELNDSTALILRSNSNRLPATDPQSVYARRRRERINERLRTLQKLVPNGTKVDISTMLEEAVQYVKFLQLQIKLLSSEDLWMYAPIAYNGMNIGL